MALRSGGFEVVDGWVTLRVVESGKRTTLRVPSGDVKDWVRHLVGKGATIQP